MFMSASYATAFALACLAISASPSNAAVVETINRTAVGCIESDDMSRLNRLLESGDRQAFEKFATRSIRAGKCRVFQPGQAVFVEDVGLFSGTACVRPKGDDTCYWVVYEAIRRPEVTPPPAPQSNAPPVDMGVMGADGVIRPK